MIPFALPCVFPARLRNGKWRGFPSQKRSNLLFHGEPSAILRRFLHITLEELVGRLRRSLQQKDGSYHAFSHTELAICGRWLKGSSGIVDSAEFGRLANNREKLAREETSNKTGDVL